MLAEQTIETIKSTAPLLEKEGKNITSLFYQKLFKNHPELQNVFNMANQAQGEQPRALADSIFAYATYIDDLDQLGPLVGRITHKHASLQVLPEQYPIVGKYLLEAIQEHLSLPDNHPVLDAWGAAYGVLADLLISAEENIYQENELRPGGWRGFREFVINDIQVETQDVRSFYLKPANGGEIASFSPGQYIGLRVQPENEAYEQIRQYSLSDSPSQDHYRITVKSEANDPLNAGKVSNLLHASQAGQTVWLQPPTGDFTIRNDDHDIVLLAGGVGLTPLLSMLLNHLEQEKPASQLTLIQCCRDREHHIMADELKRLSQTHGFAYHVSYENGEGADFQGYLTADILSKWIPHKGVDAYFCGPQPFMESLDGILGEIGLSAKQRHYETFGPSVTFA